MGAGLRGQQPVVWWRAVYRTGQVNHTAATPGFPLKTPVWRIRPWLSHITVRFSHGSCLRPRYTHLLDALFCASGNEIYAGEPRICRHMVAINAPFALFRCSPLPDTMVCSRLSVLGPSSLLKLFAFYLLSRQPGFTQQHEPLCLEERPSSVNTWLSLHVHSHLIMGQALGSEWFQYGREAAVLLTEDARR